MLDNVVCFNSAVPVISAAEKPAAPHRQALFRSMCAHGVRPQLTFLFIVSHECRAYEIIKWELNKLILCDMSAFEQEYSQVCL